VQIQAQPPGLRTNIIGRRAMVVTWPSGWQHHDDEVAVLMEGAQCAFRMPRAALRAAA
jgi:hypothetical protein